MQTFEILLCSISKTFKIYGFRYYNFICIWLLLINLKSYFYNLIFLLKGVCHEILDLKFFYDSNPSEPLINRLKYFQIRFRFCRDIPSQSSKNSTLWCACHRGVKILGLANQNFFLQIFFINERRVYP